MMPIAILKLASSGSVQMQNGVAEGDSVHPSTAIALATFNNSGAYADFNVDYNWLLSGSTANFEILATLNSGGVTGDTFGSWLNLGTTRQWSLSRSTIGTSFGNITVSIRKVGTTTVLATGTISFTCNVS